MKLNMILVHRYYNNVVLNKEEKHQYNHYPYTLSLSSSVLMTVTMRELLDEV